MRTFTLPILTALALALYTSLGHAEGIFPAFSAPPAAEMAMAAQNLLRSLDEDQRTAATFPLKDDERTNWHFVPYDRKGLPLGKMKSHQRYLAHALLNTGLSSRGYTKAMNIMGLEHVLAVIENNPERRDPDAYFVSIFGTPDIEGTWAWRFEGHHLSLNFTIIDGKVATGTPSFLASNPGELPEEMPRHGLRVLAREEDLARALVTSFTPEQQKKAIFADKAPNDILSKEKVKAEHLGDAGIPFTDLTADQGLALLELIREYVYRNRPELADADLAAIKETGLDQVHFAWAGGLEFGEGHYYRIQGPTFLLEYANTQNNARHVHATWRDFNGDFGADLLHRHFKDHHE